MILTCLTAAAMSIVSATGDDLEASLNLLDELDHVRLDVDYHDAGLEEIIDDLNARSGLSIRPDWDELAGLGVDHYTSLTIIRDSIRLADVMSTITAALDDGISRAIFEAHHGEIVFTSEDATAEMALTAVYDVRDLLARGAVEALDSLSPPIEPAILDKSESESEEGAEQEEDADTGAAEEALDAPRRELTPAEDFMLHLSDHVDPEAWIEYGGQRARYTDRNGVLIVSAPPSVHRNLQNALRQLRRANPSGVTIEAGIVEIPRSMYDRMIKRYGSSSASAARTALLARDGLVLWRSDATGSMDKTISIDSRSEGTHITLAMTPHFQAEKGLLQLDVDVNTTAGDDQRSVATTITFPATRGAAMIELPAGPSDGRANDSVRLLVLIPRRI